MGEKCRKVMVKKDRNAFRKWEKRGGKRRSETQRETRREIRLQLSQQGRCVSPWAPRLDTFSN